MLDNLSGFSAAPMLITLTGENPEFMGRRKHKVHAKKTARKIARMTPAAIIARKAKAVSKKKWFRRGATAAAVTAAPVILAPLAVMKLRKHMKKRKAQQAAKKAAEAQKKAAAAQAAATANPTPENKAAAQAATIQAATITAVSVREQAAAAAEQPAEEQAAEQPAEEQAAEQPAEEQAEQPTEEQAEQPAEQTEEQTTEETAGFLGFNYGYKDEVFAQGAAVKKAKAPARKTALVPAAPPAALVPVPPAEEKKNIFGNIKPVYVIGGAAVAGLLLFHMSKKKR